MWKKDEEPAARPAAARPSAPPSSQPSERAKIGRSIRIRGEVEGDEDLLIEGQIDGSVNLKQNAVTVGTGGEVRANINGRIVTVDGKVTGNLTAAEQVVLSGSSRVEGDITAPRVVLEDGASFRGGVDMGDHTRNGSTPKDKSADRSTSAASPEGSREGSGAGAPPGKDSTPTAKDFSSSSKETTTADKDVRSTKASAKAES